MIRIRRHKEGWKTHAERTKEWLRICRVARETREQERRFFRRLAREHRLNAGELLRVLYHVFGQAMLDMTMEDDKVDTMARRAYADAARLFAKLGLVRIHSEYGRVVLGEFVPLDRR